MLKKAGFIITAATAAVLAISPFAFADVSGGHHNGGGDAGNSIDSTSMGLANVADNNVNGTANGLCNNDVTGAGGVAAQKGVPVQGAALLAPGGAVSSTNIIGTEDGRSCAVNGTSAGDEAGN